jgi:hypothetical protein
MSDLVTTTQDAVREASIATYFGVKRTGAKIVERVKDPTGQTAAEYMGVLLLIALIVGALVALNVPNTVAQGIKDIVNEIKGGGRAPAPAEGQGGG